jgi:hypothetical protein
MAAETGIFNVLDNGLNPANPPSTNTSELQALVDLLFDPSGPTYGNGGTISFPMIETGTYEFSGTITIGPSPASIKFIGACPASGSVSPATPIPVLLQTKAADLFVVDNSPGGDANIGGVVFQDLEIEFDQSLSAGAAIHVTGGGQNVHLYRIVLLNCPQGVFFEDSLECSMIDCSIYNATTSGTPLTLGSGISNVAKETYVAGCTFLNHEPGAEQGIAVQINSVDELRMQNVRLEAYQQGIVITPGASGGGDAYHLHFGNVTCHTTSPVASAGAAVLIQPYSPHAVARVTFENCDLSQGQGKRATSYIGPGVVLDPVTGGGVIDQVRFVDTRSFLWPGAGMQIEGGTNIEVLGGYYSCNGIASGSDGVIAAGIAITGATTGVRITGAACNNSVYIIGKNHFISDSGFAPATQEYGIYVGGSASGIRVANCDLTGNLDYGLVITGAAGTPADVFINHCDVTGYTGTSQASVSVTTPVSNLQITDCPGYNDQAVQLSRPPTPPPISGETFYNRTFGYYGPISFLVWGGVVSEITIGAIITNLTSGSFMLAPNAGASVTYGTVNPSFGAVGM